MAGRTRYRLPLEPGLQRKFDALEKRVELRVVGSAADGAADADPAADAGVFRLARPFPIAGLDGAAFYAALPLRLVRELRRFRPAAIVAQSPYEAAAALVARRLVRTSTPVVVDVHGDWRTFTRLYGSPARRLLAPALDAIAAKALRGADAVRTVSRYTSAIVREAGTEPAGEFAAFMDLEPFLSPPKPLPARPNALFVGVLERYKNVDGLAAAWRLAAPKVPDATLHVVGSGTLARVMEELVRALPSQTTWSQRLRTEEIVAALDEATLLVLPSRSEGMGRVVIEALLRARPVVASRVGGIPDLVRDGMNGVLVEPGDTAALAAALVRLLSDRTEAERLALHARESAERLVVGPDEWADSLRELVDRVAS